MVCIFLNFICHVYLILFLSYWIWMRQMYRWNLPNKKFPTLARGQKGDGNNFESQGWRWDGKAFTYPVPHHPIIISISIFLEFSFFVFFCLVCFHLIAILYFENCYQCPPTPIKVSNWIKLMHTTRMDNLITLKTFSTVTVSPLYMRHT